MVSTEKQISKSLNAPQIQEFRDYRKFLLSFYNHKKSLRSGFSFRLFSKLCNLKSPNYLQLVMNGDRNLSEEMAHQVADGMKLNQAEKKYFIALVHHENAQSDEELLLAKREGLAALKKLVTSDIKEEVSEVLTDWRHLLVRELVFLPNFEPNARWVAKTLMDWLTHEEAQESLDLLIKAGLIKCDKGAWKAVDPVIDTGDDIFSKVKIQKFHQEILKNWSKNITSMNVNMQELGLINIPMNSAKIPELKNRMRQFQDEIIGWLQEEKSPNCIVQLGSYLMPATEVIDQ